MLFKELQSIYTYRHKYLGAIKYKTPKLVAHEQRALLVLALDSNYAQLFIALCKQARYKGLFTRLWLANKPILH
jgi:hypothetical protein